MSPLALLSSGAPPVIRRPPPKCHRSSTPPLGPPAPFMARLIEGPIPISRNRLRSDRLGQSTQRIRQHRRQEGLHFAPPTPAIMAQEASPSPSLYRSEPAAGM